MDSSNFWQMFLETGAPEFYLLYHNARRMEREYVLDDSGLGSSGNALQG